MRAPAPLSALALALIVPGLVLTLLLGLAGCGSGGSDGEVAASFQRVVLSRAADDETRAPKVELVGQVLPLSGVDTWEVEAPNWSFAGEGSRTRPLRMTGQGTKRVTIPGPIALDAFDRINLMVDNPAHGKVKVTLATSGGDEIHAAADVLKGRAKHPVSVKLERGLPTGETISSLVLEFEIKRALTLHGIDFVRQPLLATLPSPETGAGLLNVGTEARRAYGLGVGQRLEATVTFRKGDRIRFCSALLSPASGGADESTKCLVYVTPKKVAQSGSETFQVGETSIATQLEARWSRSLMMDMVPGEYRVRIELESSDQEAVAAIAEPWIINEGSVPARPDSTVLVVTSDTHRADHLGLTAAEGDALDTPNLDALAASGVLFESAWTTSNTTIPSHSALLTGRHPRDTKVLGNYSSLGADPVYGPKTLAEAFSKAGYQTVAVLSSSHLAHQYSGLGRGFDLVIRPEASEARAEDSLGAILASLRESGPVFLWLHLFDAHGPYLPPAAFDRRYYPKDSNPFDPSLPEIDLEGGRMPLWLRGLRDHAFPRAQYRAEIAYLDSVIGELLDHPRVASGITAFTSDHGEVFARHGVFYEHKGLTPDTLRVPLIVRAPGFRTKGERVAAPARQMDIGRTLLNLAGLQRVEFPGKDLAATASGGAEGEGDPTFAVSRRFASATQGRWHAILTLQDLSDSKDGRWAARHQVELYDIETDPGCRTDLAPKEIAAAGRYRRAIIDWLGAADPMLRASRPNLDRAAKMNLAALGYAAEAPAQDALFDTSCTCNECLKFR